MIIKENFEYPEFNTLFSWHHEPESWQIKNNQLIITSEKETDFWQRTHYGFQADNVVIFYLRRLKVILCWSPRSIVNSFINMTRQV